VFFPPEKNDPRFPCLKQMRSELQRVVTLLQERGDANLHYVDGQQLFGQAEMDAGMAPDKLHPNGDGYELMGRRFADIGFGPSGVLLAGRAATSAAL
jgi:hypothetical protein